MTRLLIALLLVTATARADSDTRCRVDSGGNRVCETKDRETHKVCTTTCRKGSAGHTVCSTRCW